MRVEVIRAALKKLLVLLGLALLVGVVASFAWQPVPLEERLVSIQAEATLSDHAGIQGQPLEVQAVLLDYADDPVLLLKAQAAVLTYPGFAGEIFPLFGQEPEFRKILMTHGESILPPIHYFLNNEVRSVALMHYTAGKYQGAKDAVANFWNSDGDAEEAVPGAAVADAPDAGISGAVRAATGQPGAGSQALTPEQRAWYAVNFIQNEGHDFLGQFVVDAGGETQWIQTERILEGGNWFFASGVRTLETKVQTGQELTAGDMGWAVVDGLAVVGAVRLLRMGRLAATSVKPVGIASRTAAYTSRIAKGSRMTLRIGRYAKWPVIVGVGYLVVSHPAIINDVLAGFAEVLGLPVRLVQTLGWAMILVPVFYLASWIMRLFIRPAVAGMQAVAGGASGKGRKMIRFS